MFDVSHILPTIINILCNPAVMALVFIGTFMGLTFGCLPGLTATLGVTLLIPITFGMESYVAIGMIIGMYVGAMAGGAVSAILLNIPGTPSAIVTCFDGYPLCQQGRGAEAMGWAAVASSFGSLYSWAVLVFVSTAIASVATSFSSPEYAALALLGLSIVGSVASDDPIKGISMAALGLFLSLVGMDVVYGSYRFTFGSINLMAGIPLMPVLLGVYSIPQVLQICNETNVVTQINVKLKNFIPSPKKLWRAKIPLLIASSLGTFIGIIPAVGSTVAVFLSYDQCKRFSKSPETFGKGNHEGIIASEASNNAVVGGALVPLLTLGIPGDSVTAILLGGLMIHGVQPGPRLFSEQPDFIIGIFTCMLIATIMMLLIQIVGIKFFIKVLSLPQSYLVAGIMCISLIGTFAVHSNFFDVGIMLVIGSFGYFLIKAKYPIPPLILGFVLGELLERETRTALILFNYDWTGFFMRPVPCVLIILSIWFFVYALYKPRKK